MKQYIGISRDHSASMGSLVYMAKSDYNNNIASIKEAANQNDIDTIVSTVRCGVGIGGAIERETVNSGINKLKPITSYVANGHHTPLFDSVDTLIRILETAPDAYDDDVSFLVMAVTDGQDNASQMTGSELGQKIKRLQNTDRWTFVFRVPVGYKSSLMRMGIPSGNIQEWEQSEQGMRESTIQTQSAVSDYFTGRTHGVGATNSFYANMSGVTKREVKAVMTNISGEVRILPVKQGGESVRDFVERKTRRNFKIGSAFYQLSKPEKAVQDYKMIVVRDKRMGDVYAGQSARDLLGLPLDGTIKLAPGNHGNYDVYIQSTSVNRRLIAGTNVLIWDAAAQLTKAAKASR